MNVFKYLTIVQLLILFASCAGPSVQSVGLKRPKGASGLYCPVSINGHVFNFIIDTGSTCTIINYPKAQEAGISVTDSCIEKLTTAKELWSGMLYSSQAEIEIGNTAMPCRLIIDNYKSKVFEDVVWKDIDGVLGMDVMAHLNWMIDLKKDSLWLSVHRLPAPVAMAPDFVVEVIGNWAYAYMACTDSIVRKFLFDTGFKGVDEILDYNIVTSLVVQDSVFKELYGKDKSNIYLSIENRVYMFHRTLKMQNLKISYGVSSNRDVYYNPEEDRAGIITSGFLDYFGYMAYDKEKKRIYLYDYSDDIARTQEMKEVYHNIIEACKGRIDANNILKKEL